MRSLLRQSRGGSLPCAPPLAYWNSRTFLVNMGVSSFVSLLETASSPRAASVTSHLLDASFASLDPAAPGVACPASGPNSSLSFAVPRVVLWNAQGLCHFDPARAQRKLDVLASLFATHDVVCVLETHHGRLSPDEFLPSGWLMADSVLRSSPDAAGGILLAWRESCCELLEAQETCPGRVVAVDLVYRSCTWRVIGAHLHGDSTFSWSELCQAVASLVEPPDGRCLLVVDANVVLQPEDRVNRAGSPCGIVGGRAREFNRLIGSLSDINPVLSHVDPGSGTVACLQRCLTSLPPPDVWVLDLTLSIVCLPLSSPPLSDHSPVSLSPSARPLSELGLPQWLASHPRWEECLRFWLRSIPSKGDGFAARWQVVEEAIHLAAKDVRYDRSLVPEGHVPLNFALVSQALRAALVGK